MHTAAEITVKRGSTIALAALALFSLAFAREQAGRPLPRAAGVGDAARGAKLYERLPCASCHDITRPWPGGDICPNLGNIATEAARIIRLREYRGRARDAAGYIRESIVDPDAYIVPRPAYRQADGQSVMPKNFGQTLTAAELDDLVAFLLTRR
jgi:nitric oxide reductase subunit C